jgi:hypothetical protein
LKTNQSQIAKNANRKQINNHKNSITSPYSPKKSVEYRKVVSQAHSNFNSTKIPFSNSSQNNYNNQENASKISAHSENKNYPIIPRKSFSINASSFEQKIFQYEKSSSVNQPGLLKISPSSDKPDGFLNQKINSQILSVSDSLSDKSLIYLFIQNIQ